MAKELRIKKKTLYKILITIVIVALAVIVFKIIIPTNPGNDMGVFEDKTLFPSLGPDNAAHTVIEFSDFQCPWCAVSSGLPEWAKNYAQSNPQVAANLGASAKVEDLAKEGKVRFIYVPMSFVGTESVNAAEAALCAKEQNKFWEMQKIIFTNNDGKENNGVFTKDTLKGYASEISGLDTNEFNNCLENSKTLAQVNKINQIAITFTSSTPTFFVDGEKVSSSWSEIEKALE